VVEQPRGRGRRHRHVHRVRHQGPPQGPRVLRRGLAALDLRRLLPVLPRPLEKYGLTIPHDLVEESWNRIWNKGYIHEVAQFFATGWFANYWRIDAMDDDDFEWFEYKYPGWYDKYGKWWEKYSELSKKNGHKPIAFEAEAELRVPAPLLDLHGPVPDP
jgi:hypothetical protein